MRNLLLFIFFLLSKTAFSQTDFTKIYHPIINEAELAIVEDNHAEALSLYKEAFSLVEKPFAKDYYNAAVCAVFTNRLSLAFEFLEKIIEKGYPVDSLRKDKFFKSVADTSKRWNNFEKQAKLIKPTINIELRDSLRNILKEIYKEIDIPISNELRAFYKKEKPALMPTDSLLFHSNMTDSLKKMYFTSIEIRKFKYSNRNYQLFLKTLNLINIYGFPDENLIGLSNYSVSLNKKGIFEVKTTEVPLLSSTEIADISNNMNFSDSSKMRKQINQYIFQAVHDGKLLPKYARLMLDSQNNENDVYHMDNVSVFQLRLDNDLKCESELLKDNSEKWFWKKKTSPFYTKSEISEKRRNIGLENLDDAYRKVFYNATYPKNPFLLACGSYSREIFYVATCETAEKVLRESVELK